MTPKQDVEQLKQILDTHIRVVRCMRRATVCILAEGEQYVMWWGNGPVGGHVCSGVKGGCGCAHAEQKALPWMLARLRDLGGPLRLLSWLGPCTGCANLIIAAQGQGLDVKQFAYVDELEHDQLGKRLLRNAGIDVVRLDK